MKALTLHRPWPWAILHAPADRRKGIENRSWKPWASIIGQTIALHSGRHYDKEGAKYIAEQMPADLFGLIPFKSVVGLPHWDDEGIVGTVRVVRWFKPLDPEFGKDPSIPPGQARWCFGPFCWVLEDVRALVTPIPCKGHQGLWDVPEEIAQKLAA